MKDKKPTGQAASGVALFGSSAKILERHANDVRVLTEDELGRAATLIREADRRDFIASHLLVRLAASHLTGVPLQELRVKQRCEVCGGPHGRPHLDGYPALHLSLSRTRSVVAAVCSTEAVAVDIEHWDSALPGLSELRLALSPAEAAYIDALPAQATTVSCSLSAAAAAFLQIWTRKECLVKLDAATLDTFSSIDLSGAMSSDPLPATGHVRHFGYRTRKFSEWCDQRMRIVGTLAGEAYFQPKEVCGHDS